MPTTTAAPPHRLRPSGSGWIGSFWRACMTIDQTTSLHGPFASLAEFNDFLVAPVQDCPRPELAAKYRNVPSDDYCIMFACADFSGENILVDPENGSVTGMAGFWPKWWEFRRGLFASRPR
ncbi:hypothetical protein MHUMG1_10330 [Metarhizium humberi]|uniref:Uncharacterized protein n=1 Tax=Metarhizium humberi TaxID=2596975 RepID=A0A9P8M4J5_9HYPO|nr:hypothetical protein MHUMG1_10330 [Metarhizium humberi]